MTRPKAWWTQGVVERDHTWASIAAGSQRAPRATLGATHLHQGCLQAGGPPHYYNCTPYGLLGPSLAPGRRLWPWQCAGRLERACICMGHRGLGTRGVRP